MVNFFIPKIKVAEFDQSRDECGQSIEKIEQLIDKNKLTMTERRNFKKNITALVYDMKNKLKKCEENCNGLLKNNDSDRKEMMAKISKELRRSRLQDLNCDVGIIKNQSIDNITLDMVSLTILKKI